ncbi:MAG: rod shape-determining protein MreD [Pseudomonadota bacterium]
MANRSPSKVWLMRGVYLALSLLILFFQLLPLDTLPRQLAPPDLLIAFTFAWSMRRPDYVPAAVVALAMLAADLLLQRPPGLLAALCVAASAYLKSRTLAVKEIGFASEWALVSVVLLSVLVLNRLILAMTVSVTAPILLDVSALVLTIITYPAVAAISQLVFGVRKPSRSDADALGAGA